MVDGLRVGFHRLTCLLGHIEKERQAALAHLRSMQRVLASGPIQLVLRGWCIPDEAAMPGGPAALRRGWHLIAA